VNWDHTVWVIPSCLPAIPIACTIHGRAWSRATTPVKTRADTLVLGPADHPAGVPDVTVAIVP